MKKTLYFTFALSSILALNACQVSHDNAKMDDQKSLISTVSQNLVQENNVEMTTATFDEISYNFGEIAEGDIATHTYKVKNTGENPLTIEVVKPSCGCTAPNWTKEPIPVGEYGNVEIQFNSAGKKGAQKKSISVTFANTEPKVQVLTFTAEVVPMNE